jgi:hypothetical protein
VWARGAARHCIALQEVSKATQGRPRFQQQRQQQPRLTHGRVVQSALKPCPLHVLGREAPSDVGLLVERPERYHVQRWQQPAAHEPVRPIQPKAENVPDAVADTGRTGQQISVRAASQRQGDGKLKVKAF